MQQLLRKNQDFFSIEKHQEAFDSVKQAVADATVSAVPNEKRRFVLDTDCSCNSRVPTPKTRTQWKDHLTTYRLWQ